MGMRCIIESKRPLLRGKMVFHFYFFSNFRYAVRGEEIPRNSKISDHIIIGTPGKVLDWSLKFKFFDLKKIKVFVLDEADVMIATQGHQDQSIRIQKNLSTDCQMMLFSATYDQDVMNFAENIISNPVVSIYFYASYTHN